MKKKILMPILYAGPYLLIGLGCLTLGFTLAQKPIEFKFNQNDGVTIYKTLTRFEKLIPKTQMPIDTAIMVLSDIDKIRESIQKQLKAQTDTTKIDTIKNGKGKSIKSPH